MRMATLTAPTPKQQARALIERLPDTATWTDVAEALALEEGLADVKAGRLVDGDQVLRWLDSWGTDHELPSPRA
jgi:predicted transcriptional regulator